MTISKHKEMTIELVYDAEQNAEMYREALLEMSLENDQLYSDYCMMCDKIVHISARIDMVDAGLSSPEIALAEIGDIIEVECR